MAHPSDALLPHDIFVINAMGDRLVRDAVGHYLGISLVSRGVLTHNDIPGYLDVLADTSTNLRDKADLIRTSYLRADDPTSPYSIAYAAYAENVRATHRLQDLEALHGANRIVDIGAGSGKIALKLAEQGRLIIATDVHDYLDDEARSHPNIQFMHTASLPELTEPAEGAFAWVALHHVQDMTTLLTSLRQALKPGSKFVVCEETPPPSASDGPLDHNTTTDLDYMYREIGQERSLQVIGISDYVSNWVATGGYGMPLPFAHRTIGEWRTTLGLAGFETTSVAYNGIPPATKKWTPVPGARIITENRWPR